ncbi:MAG: hypothetical protein AUK53_01840 [Betaproteobacteria bacterium CG2_30_59_46]|nr:MAG: hypothetical protein AUK53_01840 [Betaproteobacteria bacterium CG2_30_59_46]PIQ12989.1 MAG: hypothetical protein COW70_07030 [Hydrogenophilales bacterium CG18_big_fil_WC_8_21_14_2_50_58_12]PIY01375.1 MAG: hypothetical protein COZ23_03520 [Hydrogenophilales bacterium CG_4_10_14_3_um_filter_58_23]PJB05292.1 MAG: hypothetical protein CO125_09380 [Hydrogenophilales bacterium CG_4_9_14_3_um_filter_59_35]
MNTIRQKRMKAEDRKKSIIQASKGLFAKKGLHGVSVDEIARACGVSPAVLYQHFPSKEKLYEAVLGAAACNREYYLDAVLGGPDGFGDVLYRMTLVFVKSRIADVDTLRIELRSIIDGDGISEQFFMNQWRSFIDYIEISLNELMKEGQIPQIDIPLAALAFVGLCREVMLSQTMHIGEKRFQDIEYMIREMVNFYLRMVGLKALPPDAG